MTYEEHIMAKLAANPIPRIEKLLEQIRLERPIFGAVSMEFLFSDEDMDLGVHGPAQRNERASIVLRLTTKVAKEDRSGFDETYCASKLPVYYLAGLDDATTLLRLRGWVRDALVQRVLKEVDGVLKVGGA